MMLSAVRQRHPVVNDFQKKLKLQILYFCPSTRAKQRKSNTQEEKQ